MNFRTLLLVALLAFAMLSQHARAVGFSTSNPSETDDSDNTLDLEVNLDSHEAKQLDHNQNMIIATLIIVSILAGLWMIERIWFYITQYWWVWGPYWHTHRVQYVQAGAQASNSYA